MSKAVVCIGDHCTGMPIHVCVSGSEDVFVNGRPACRKGDILTIGETVTQGVRSGEWQRKKQLTKYIKVVIKQNIGSNVRSRCFNCS